VITATEYARSEEQSEEQRAKGEGERAKSEGQRAKGEAEGAKSDVQSGGRASGQLDLFEMPEAPVAPTAPQVLAGPQAPPTPQTPAAPPLGNLSEVVIESVGIDFSRPHGKRFGTLVHAVLSIVDLTANAGSIQQIANLQGRFLGATQTEIEAAIETVNRSLAHPLLRRASKAMRDGRCRREAPISMQLEDGTILEGNVDLAFLEEGEHAKWTVIDFKTDFEIAGRLDEYCKQVALYARAISLATSTEAKGVLLRM
jgi:ATP-dependent exoDNAse (exonuclease V) beta subunit